MDGWTQELELLRFVAMQPEQIPAWQRGINDHSLNENHPCMQPPTGAILLIKWNVLSLQHTYQSLKVRGCEGLGAGIPKNSLNSGRQGPAKIILEPLGKQQPTDFISIRRRPLVTLLWVYHHPNYIQLRLEMVHPNISPVT